MSDDQTADREQDFVDATPDHVAETRTNKGRFKPGVSGNPAGGSKKLVFRTAIMEYLDENPDALPEVIKTLVEAARGKEENFRGERVNHLAAASIIKGIIDGKDVQQVQLTGAEEGPMVINHIIESMGGE